MAYATVNEFKLAIGNLRSTDPDVLANIQMFLDGAENAIDTAMNHPHGFVADASASYRHYSADGSDELMIDECVEIVSVAVKTGITVTTYTAWTTPSTYFAHDGDWYPYPFNAEARGKPYTRIIVDPSGGYAKFTDGKRKYPTVRVSAKWGFSIEVPPLIKTICIAQAGRWYNQGQGGMSDFIADPETGELKYTRSLRPEFVTILKQAGFWNPSI